MKFGNKILISALVLGIAAYSTYTTIQKGNTMNNTSNETYTVIAPNGREVKFDKNTNLVVLDDAIEGQTNNNMKRLEQGKTTWKSSQNSFFKLVKSSTPLLTKTTNLATLIQILTTTDKRSIYPLNLGIN